MIVVSVDVSVAGVVGAAGVGVVGSAAAGLAVADIAAALPPCLSSWHLPGHRLDPALRFREVNCDPYCSMYSNVYTKPGVRGVEEIRVCRAK